MDENVLTTAEAAKLLGVTVTTLNRWVNSGRIRALFEGPGTHGARFYDRADIETAAQEGVIV